MMKKVMLIVMLACMGLWATSVNDMLNPNEKVIEVCPFTSRVSAELPASMDGRQAEDTISFDAYTNVTGIGYGTAGTQWEAAIRLTPTELSAYAGYNLIAVVVYRTTYTSIGDSIKIYDEGTPTSAGALLLGDPFTPAFGTWNRIDLSTPVPISGATDLWISDYHEESPGGWPMGAGPGPIVAGQGGWLYNGGTWTEISVYGLDYNWNIWAIVAPGAPQNYVWDFEDGWQGWTHTNGQAFPAGWSVEPSGYYPSWTCPDAGDSSMWIDSDAAGAATWVADTAKSPAVVPPMGMEWLKYGIGYNYISGAEFVEVGLFYHDGATWTAAPLVTYTADTGPMWDSFDVSAYAGYDSVQVYFYYDDMDVYAWYVTFDNVSLYAPAAHDVATASIDVPGTMFAPGVITPTATYENLGPVQETFDVYYQIDSSGTTIYNETVNVTVDPGADTTHQFPTWEGFNNCTYDITCWTDLTGDDNPANDTLMQTSLCTAAYWKIYANMPAALYYNACVYSEATGTPVVYNIGGNPNFTAIYDFDIATETWSTNASVLNTGVQRNAAAESYDRIYSMGGADAGFTAVANNQEFDPVAGTVTDRTPLPTARHFLGAVTSSAGFIYVMGGQSTTYHNVVEVYNPVTDAWFTATSLPLTNRSFACGIDPNDNIYVAGGYNGGYVTGAWVGAIDPADSSVINWTAIPDIPIGASGTPGRSRVQGACVEKTYDDHWVFYFTGGDDHGTTTYDTWFYDPDDGLWHQDLDKPTPISNSQCAVHVPDVLATPADDGVFFCAGGFNTFTGVATDATEGLVGQYDTGIEEYIVREGVSGSFGFAPMATIVNNRTQINYTTTIPGIVSLSVYDRAGRLVENLVNTFEDAGTKSVTWNVSNIANGVYFIQLDGQGESASTKLVIVK
jgi:hypothetical protein